MRSNAPIYPCFIFNSNSQNPSQWPPVGHLLHIEWTRQGCPLSPLIFVLTLEPLLCRLRANPDRIWTKRLSIQISSLCGWHFDVPHRSNPITSIPNLLKDFSLFNTLSNFQINFSKSHALNISLPQSSLTHCQNNFAFGWDSHAITYLEVHLPVKLFQNNFPEIYSRSWESSNKILKNGQRVLSPSSGERPLSRWMSFQESYTSFKLCQIKSPRLSFPHTGRFAGISSGSPSILGWAGID